MTYRTTNQRRGLTRTMTGLQHSNRADELGFLAMALLMLALFIGFAGAAAPMGAVTVGYVALGGFLASVIGAGIAGLLALIHAHMAQVR